MENTANNTSQVDRDFEWDQHCAQSICQALSGSSNPLRIKMYLGAKNVTVIRHGLRFGFHMCHRANFCRITVTPADTYNVIFYKTKLSKFKSGADPSEQVEQFECYCDELQERFENYTGLVTAARKVTFG